MAYGLRSARSMKGVAHSMCTSQEQFTSLSSCRTPVVLAHRRAPKLLLCLAATQSCGLSNRISVHQVRTSSLNFSGETIDYIGLPIGTCMYQTASRFALMLFIVIFGKFRTRPLFRSFIVSRTAPDWLDP